MKTEDLIATLASRATPVRPLASPGVRLLGWTIVALGSAAAGIAVFGARAGIADHLRQPEFAGTAILALVTTVLAAAAALVLAVPGAERTPVARGAAAALIAAWGAALAVAIARSGHGFAAVADWPICFLRVIGIGALPAVLLVILLRRAAPLRLGWTAALAAAAAMSVAAAAIQFICPFDDPGHALLGHFGPVVVLGAAAAWQASRLLPRRDRLRV